MSVARSSLLFSLGTLVSRFAGLLRDRIVLSVFGASELMSGFIIAFRIPNMLREMLAEGALGSSFTKVYSELATKDKERARLLLLDALILMTIASIIICIIGIIIAPYLVKLMTSEAESGPQMIAVATGLTRLLFPFLGCMILGAICMGALHQKGTFFLTSVSPVFFNIFNILGALFFAKWLDVYGPEWIEKWIAPKAITGFTLGVLLGGLGQLLAQLYGIWSELSAAWQTYHLRSPWTPDIRKMLLLMGPMALAASAGQIRTVINNYFATTAGAGAVVWLDSAFRLLQLPIGLFGVAISSAVLPALSKALAAAGGRVNEKASLEIQNAVELVLWLMAPCFAFYAVNNVDVVKCLLQSGHFKAYDAEQTGSALFAYSFALLGYGLSKVMTSFYFALERTRFALYVSLATIVFNASINWYLVSHHGHTGLAWGYSVTQTLSIGLLVYGMRGHHITINRTKGLKSFGLLTLAILLSVAVMEFALRSIRDRHLFQSGLVWVDSGLVLLINGTLCLAIFATFGLSYLRLTPQKAWAKLAQRRRSPRSSAK
jgi:putative peptidoglycan lipid II flippase